MKSMITGHPYGALSIPASGPEERRARVRADLTRVAVLDPEQLPLALALLSGYYPRVFEEVVRLGGDTRQQSSLVAAVPPGQGLGLDSSSVMLVGRASEPDRSRRYRLGHW
jgi:hypothetical protein